ncbi:MAG: histidine kinase [Bacteroidota bacterium]
MITQTDKSLFLRIGGHVLFWLILISIFYYNSIQMGWVDNFWWYMIWLMPIDLGAVYFTAYYLIPKFLLQKRYKTFFFTILVSALSFVLMQRCISYFIVFPAIYVKGLERPFFFLPELWNTGISMYTYVFLFSGVRVFHSLLMQQRQQYALEKQNLHSELAMLRAQISPHFLFNTLNNIDFLVYHDQAKASDSLMRLSEIMRYMLYEANVEQVPLEREVAYLSSMIELLRLRLDNPDFIQLEVDGDLSGKYIPPMLLVPFVENAFKHGKKQGAAPGITIQLSANEQVYRFEVKNQIDRQGNPSKDAVGGIGLQNVRRRLMLLFGNNYQLDLCTEEYQFRAFLQIPASLATNEKKQYGAVAYT